jgi:RNA polymerase sigma-70 factor (ECF subfamily)
MDLYLTAEGGTANVTKAAAADQPGEEALRWFDELRHPLRRYLLCAGASPADADDAVQEAFLRLYRHLQKSGDRSNVYGWLFQVARNYLHDQRKSARHQRTVPLDQAMERESHFADPRGTPEQDALLEERTRRLRASIEKLPEPQRECMLLRSSGLRYREIAAVLGIRTSSIGKLVERAMARLNEDLR